MVSFPGNGKHPSLFSKPRVVLAYSGRRLILIRMQIGQIFRSPSPRKDDEPIVDGLPNLWYHMLTAGTKDIQLAKGIWTIARLSGADGIRRPAIILSSTLHKAGGEQTPWQDVFDLDVGRLRYFGDNRTPGKDPATQPGNKALLEQMKLHASPDKEVRRSSAPLVVFRRVVHKGIAKGHVAFQGFGIIERVELITQIDPRSSLPFANYVFEIAIFSLQKEHEVFDWEWISARRMKSMNLTESEAYAPDSWKRWVERGQSNLAAVRRRVARHHILTAEEQCPKTNSRQNQILNAVYEFYSSRKHRFEGLAARITSRVLGRGATNYVEGWITDRAGDGGVDFVGRLDVGDGFSKAKLIVLGQAKCEKLTTPTGGNHIARTVARLRRGYIGVYVTTSYFSKPVQVEVIEDRFPLVLINGLRIAEEINSMMVEVGRKDIGQFLDELDKDYDGQLMNRGAEEILDL